jgi:hypothetical protein
MALQQVAASYALDGNFSQLDLQDCGFNGLKMRIETYRCSHPSNGDNSRTHAGTNAAHLTGDDHLSPISNRIFRHIFSIQDDLSMKVTLEIREMFNENGDWSVRIRDTDIESPSFGSVLSMNVTRREDEYELDYRLLRPRNLICRELVTSPLVNTISRTANLIDIGADLEELGFVKHNLACQINWKDPEQVDRQMSSFVEAMMDIEFNVWSENLKTYTRFGDFRDKCIHSGENLTGNHPQLASEYILVRAYRSSLILTGRLFDMGMIEATQDLWNHPDPLSIDSKPGNYAVFILAYIFGVSLYQLGLDKVHSDYSGIPMKKAPGSRLETGSDAIYSSRRANETLAQLAVAFYKPIQRKILALMTD